MIRPICYSSWLDGQVNAERGCDDCLLVSACKDITRAKNGIVKMIYYKIVRHKGASSDLQYLYLGKHEYSLIEWYMKEHATIPTSKLQRATFEGLTILQVNVDTHLGVG